MFFFVLYYVFANHVEAEGYLYIYLSSLHHLFFFIRFFFRTMKLQFLLLFRGC